MNRVPRLVALAAVALAGASAVLAAVVGETTAPLDGRPVRKAECSLGDLVADSARAAVKADVALIQAGLLREELLPAGPLTDEQLKAVLLYPEEQVVLVELPGRKLQAALERGLSALPQPSAAFLQVSGVRVTFRSQAPAGNRIETVLVGEKPLVPDQSYRAAVSASLAKGALGYFRVFNGLKPKEVGPPLHQALGAYVRANSPLRPGPGDRLRDLSAPPAR